MPQPLVSVVTPVHNGESHLVECIESVLGQTYENWHYVIADNSSTDGTREIAERYATVDARIRYAQFDEFVSVGASHNRAVGLVSLESRYCKVLGADDWLYPESLSRMVEVAEAHPSVGVVSSFRLTDSRVDLVGIPYGAAVTVGPEVVAQSLRYSLEQRRLSVLGSPSALLLRSDVVRERTPFYDENLRHSDSEAILGVLMRSDLGFVHQVLSYSREPPVAETTLSNHLGSVLADQLLFVARYGPATLSPEDFREELNADVAAYARYHSKQRLKPSRLSDVQFREYHRRAIDQLLGQHDAQLARRDRLALRYVRALLH
jgi:glycosyltransferase involved in cell wall biosynthesis